MQCVHIPNGGFRRGSYRCVCPPSRRLVGTVAANGSGSAAAADPSAAGALDGVDLEKAYVDKLLSGAFGPPVTCPSCERACMAEYDPLLRGIPLGVQTLCITVTIVLTVVVVRLRKTKVRLTSTTKRTQCPACSDLTCIVITKLNNTCKETATTTVTVFRPFFSDEPRSAGSLTRLHLL